MMHARTCLVCLLLALAATAGCTDDDPEAGTTATGGQSPSTGTGATPATGGGALAAGRIAATGGVSIGDLLACSDRSPAAICGGVECPPQTGNEAAGCLFPCCLVDETGAEHCGRQLSNVTVATPCVVMALPDPSCPNRTTSLGEAELVGCCMPSGAACGIIEPVGGGCTTQFPLAELPATPPPCDGSGLVTDAGTSDASASDAGMDGAIP